MVDALPSYRSMPRAVKWTTAPVWWCFGMQRTASANARPVVISALVLVIHPVAMIKNWKHGLKCLRQNVAHADKHFTHTTQPTAHTSQLGRRQQV